MAAHNNIFTTIRTEGALLPTDLLQRISEGANIDGLTAESYHRPGEKLNEAINRSWNALQGAWASFRTARERLPENDLGTSITRERWLLPLFRELDYGRLQIMTAVEIDGRSYPISHGWEHVPMHLVSYKVELDRRTPGATGASAASPHSLLQVFLNRSADHLWGFLSNGYKLRILRDNLTLTRQAYIEFDLEAMMEGEVYSDFVLLWLLCHQSRVEGERPADCWLEKWMKVAEDQGIRVLDRLRKGVEEAISALGVGFVEHHANSSLRDKLTSGELKTRDYYHQLLRMVYRLLFLFVAEDRDLLLNPDAPQDARERYTRYYSTQRLRHMAEHFKGTRHADLFEGLRLVMRLLSGDNNGAGAGLGLVPLGSFLFSDAAVADIIDCQISNQHLLDAIRALSQTYDQRAQAYRAVDYKNLGSDEFGSIFESLLELHPDINIPARSFTLTTKAGNERKTSGSYYTPESLVNALLDSALDPVLAAAISGDNPQPPAPSPSGRRGDDAVWRARATEAIQHIAKDLRQRQTPAETIIWEALRDRRLDGLKFRRQHAIANTAYVVDFLCYEARLIVEIDGGIHEAQREADAIRQQALEAEGYRVIRFTNEQVYDDLKTVLSKILSTAHLLSEGEGLGVRVNTPEQRILALKVCDPACGSGHFLIAAANRIAKALASVRTGEEEPSPIVLQEAKRDVISACIYGVDINPMAVELCKVNLWMEALEPGKPLNFLDHRIQVGNSLLGTTPKLMEGGIPDDAFVMIEGDDKAYTLTMKKRNKHERAEHESQQIPLFVETVTNYTYLSQSAQDLGRTPDDSLDAVRYKEAQYAALANDPEYLKAQLLADAWCSAFVWEKQQNEHLIPMTDRLYRRLEQDPLAEDLQSVRATVVQLKERYQFFHWHVAFPDVFTVPEDITHAQNEHTGWQGGFDCVLGNPPWERIKIQEKEWFAQRDPAIATAPNAAVRREMIKELAKSDPHLLQAFDQDKRKAEGESHFVRNSQRYPLTGRGDVNTYTLFAESARHIINDWGRVGMIVPSGIATDDTTKFFFQDLMQTRALVSLYDFENREGLFIGVHRSYKFALLTLRAASSLALREQGFRGEGQGAEFVFFALNVNDLADPDKRFTLSAEEIALLNPNTGTMATFRSVRDAEITKDIYRRVPVLIQEDPLQNPWGISFLRMFDMSNDSDKFRTREALEPEGFTLEGNHFVRGDARYLPLYEGKMFMPFDHRYANVVLTDNLIRSGQAEFTKDYEKQLADFVIMPRSWVHEDEVINKTSNNGFQWLIGFKNVTAPTNERTFLSTILPIVAVGNSIPLMFSNNPQDVTQGLVANLAAFIFDYTSRQKMGNVNLNFYIVQQLPVIPPHTYTQALLDFIVPRVLELTYTAWDLQPFAQDIGYDGPPFVWDEERRFLLRCELDALYFHLYQIQREDVDYIMETFPIVKRKDEARTALTLNHAPSGERAFHAGGEDSAGEYITKRIILEMYDQMAALPVMHVPAPKDEHSLYAVPDVRLWEPPY